MNTVADDNITVTVDGLGSAIETHLNSYSNAVIKGTKAAAKSSMDDLVRETKKTAPVRTGELKKHIASKQTLDGPLYTEYTWYVKAPDFRLVHLVENGHVTRNGKRTKATHFVKTATDKVVEGYTKRIEEVIRDG